MSAAADREAYARAILDAGAPTDPALLAFVEELRTSLRANGVDVDAKETRGVAGNLASWLWARFVEKDEELRLAAIAIRTNEETIATLQARVAALDSVVRAADDVRLALGRFDTTGKRDDLHAVYAAVRGPLVDALVAAEVAS